MNYFQPDPDRTITSAWIDQGFEIDPNEILQAIEWEQSADSIDKNLGFGATAFGVLGIAALLGLSGITAFMLPPAGLAAYGAISGYNSAISRRRRELEEEFLQDYPAILDLVAQKLAAGESDSKAAAAFDAVFRHYRKGNDEAIAATIATTQPPQLPQTQLEQPAPYIASPPQDQDASQQQQPESLALGGSQQAARPSRIEWNPAIDLGRNPQSALIAGTPGSGKGMLVSNAIRELRAKYPDLKVMLIDPKNDVKETGYWAGTVDICRRFCLMDCPDPDEGAGWLLACMDEFRQLPSPKLLIFDELFASAIELKLASKELKAIQKFKKFIVGVLSQGDSLDCWLWAMSQSVNADDIGLSGGTRTNLRAIGLISPKNIGAIEGLTSTRLIPQPDGGMDELRALMDASPVGRAVYDAKIARWVPMPKLENHSGYNRDSRQSIGTPRATSQIEQLERLYRESPALDTPIEPTGTDTDPIEADILALLKSRYPEGLTAGRIRADKKSLKSVDAGEIEFYLEVLLEERKIRKDGNLFYYK